MSRTGRTSSASMRARRSSTAGRHDHVPAHHPSGSGVRRAGLELGLGARRRPFDPYDEVPPDRDRALRVHEHRVVLRGGGGRHPHALGARLLDEARAPADDEQATDYMNKNTKEQMAADQGADRGGRRQGRRLRRSVQPQPPCDTRSRSTRLASRARSRCSASASPSRSASCLPRPQSSVARGTASRSEARWPARSR